MSYVCFGPHSEEDLFWCNSHAQEGVVIAVVTDVVELETTAYIFGSRFQFTLYTFNSDIPRRVLFSLSAPFAWYLIVQSETFAKFLYEVLSNISDFGIRKPLDPFER